MPDEISHALETQRVSLGERARDEDVRILQRECHRILIGEIHISFVQHHDTPLCFAESVEFCGRVAPTTRSIRRREESERRIEIPNLAALQFWNARQTEIRVERYRDLRRAVNVRQHWIK